MALEILQNYMSKCWGLTVGGGKRNSQINGVFVDTEYVNSPSFFGLPLFSIDDGRLKKECNIIIGFNIAPNIVKERLSKIHGIDVHYHVLPIDVDGPCSLSYQYIKQHITDFEKIYDICADDLSRQVLIEYINAKISGRTDKLWNVISEDRYFPKDILKISKNEVYLDCGAYDGADIISFLKHVNNDYSKIYAFEPDLKSIRLMKNRLVNNNIKNIEYIQCGLWNEPGFCNFVSDEQGSRIVMTTIVSDYSIKVDTIDNICNGVPVSIIKMDIEGSEVNTLRGAENTIRINKPKLIICAYHKQDDIFKIPNEILRMNPEYKIYFRHHNIVSMELVCYAV